MQLQRRNLFLHLTLPALVGAGLVGMFFSGVGWVQSLVVPVVNREYGLLENLQLVLLLALSWVGWRSARRAQRRVDRACWNALGVFAH